MVGSVLMKRMIEEQDFKDFEPIFFTTSNIGGKSPNVGIRTSLLKDAFDIELLSSLDIIVTCQGGNYTQNVYKKLRNSRWSGYWIDTASFLRMDKASVIVLDPVNREIIDNALISGIKTFVGGNCTVSLMLIALSGLFAAGHINWISSMTYQAASGAGAKYMKELIAQMAFLGDSAKAMLDNPASSAIEIDNIISEQLRGKDIPNQNFTVPLAGSLIPWIDSLMESGQTKEEWKGFAETNKILQTKESIPIDGLCIRVGAVRCHSQALMIKLNHDIPLKELSEIIKNGNQWVKLVTNNKEATLQYLTPASVNGRLTIPVGRLKKMLMGPKYITTFTVGDQLLWGAAEPIRRILKIIIRFLS